MTNAPTTSSFSFTSHFASLVWNKAVFNLKSETSKTHLSYIWWVVEPIIYMIIFYVVLGLILQRGGPDFIPFLLTGLVPFQWISKSIIESSESILQGRGLMLQIKISPLFFPLTRIVTTTLKEIPGFVLLITFILLTGYSPGISWLALPLILCLQLLFTVALCFVIALAMPFVRDLKRLIPVGVQFILFSSGVFYPTDFISKEWIDIFFLNPVAGLFHLYRQILLQGEWPDFGICAYIFSVTSVILFSVWLIYRRTAPIYAKIINE